MDEWQRDFEKRRPLLTLNQAEKKESTYVYIPSIRVSSKEMSSSIFSSNYGIEGFITPYRSKGIEWENDKKEENEIQPQSAPAKIIHSLNNKLFNIYYDEETYLEIPNSKVNHELYSLEMNKENVSPIQFCKNSKGKKCRL